MTSTRPDAVARADPDAIAGEVEGPGSALHVLMMLSAIQMGGAERVLIRLIPHLERTGVAVTLCTVTDRVDPVLDAELTATRVRRTSLGAQRGFDAGAWRRLRRLLTHGGFAVVHAHDSQSQTVAGFVGRTTRVPVVVTRHVVAENLPTRRARARALAARLAMEVGATQVVAVSDAARHEVQTSTRMPAARVRTVHNGIDTDHFVADLDRAAARAALGWEPDRPTVTIVAVARPEKGHEVLFAALPALRERIPGVVVKLVGVEPGEAIVRARPDLAGVVDAVGVHHDVRPAIAASDVVVLPSWYEALPTVLLEAGAMERPVVATRVGGVPEIVDDGRTGLLVEAGDAGALAERLARLLLDPVAGQAMGRAARTLVRDRFSYPVQAAALRALYDELVGVP
jgi:glycosyltransferase involved in cell wall biosynthesis